MPGKPQDRELLAMMSEDVRDAIGVAAPTKLDANKHRRPRDAEPEPFRLDPAKARKSKRWACANTLTCLNPPPPMTDEEKAAHLCKVKEHLERSAKSTNGSL